MERPQHLPVTTAQSEPRTPREHGDLIRSFLLPAVFGVFTGFAILATTLTEQLALRGAPTTAVAAGILAISFIGALQEIVRGGNGAAAWTGWLCGLLSGILGPLLLVVAAARAMSGHMK